MSDREEGYQEFDGFEDIDGMEGDDVTRAGAGYEEDDDPDELEADLLQRSKEAFVAGTTYFENSVKRQLEKNISNHRGKHPVGSKYYTTAYAHRSKLFRPKTRAMTRRQEAAMAMALFATQDTLHVAADNDNDSDQRVSAAILGELASYRLRKSIPWFQIAIGAYQEALTMGTVISKQYWEYREDLSYAPAVSEDGEPILNESGEEMYQEVISIVEDHPVISLRPRENILFDAASDWTDPVGTSPYLIDMVPMYACDLKDMISRPSPKGATVEWRDVTDDDIQSAMRQRFDSLRQRREGDQRQDSKDADIAIKDYTIVWVHENFIKYDGKEYVFWTLGDSIVISEPKELGEVYFTGKRPYTCGNAIIEAHRTNPSAPVELGEGLQAEANEIANQRIDNIRLAMNKRYFIRRGATVDNNALKRNVPGGGVLMDDINGDVKVEETNDVTASSYKEQDRLNLDFDELMGTFSAGSIQSNRSMNETVGGMEMLGADSNVMTEYQMRTFVETWVEPTLRQLVELEQAYETDATVIAIAGEQAKIFSRFGKTAITDDDLQGELVTTVSVGFGATNPQKRVEKLALGLRMVGEVAPELIQSSAKDEIVAEIFGALGFRDGKRFFPTLGEQQQQPDPMVAQLQQELQKAQQMLQSRMDVEQVKQQGASQRQQMKQEHELKLREYTQQIDYLKQQIAAEGNDIKKGELMLQQRALEGQQAQSELDYLLQERNSMAQVLQNNKYGQVPGAEG